MRTADVTDEPTSKSAPVGDPSADRVCLACGYSLCGLGEEPRCPECGLLNIPTGYREQVWELVDSGKWFFSSFFGVFAKRPPGWWWALDRPDDLRRARRFAMWHLGVSLIVILVAMGLADAVRMQMVITYRVSSTLDDMGRPLEVPGGAATYGVANRQIQYVRNYDVWKVFPNRFGAGKPLSTVSWRKVFGADWSFIPIAGVVYVTVVLIWGIPATGGLWTQIRKGLPDFARAPRTIIAASLLEAHRMTYVAICAAALLGVDAFRRVILQAANPIVTWAFLMATPTILVAFAASGWIGPLRSDYTRQLVRLRWHATRMLAMYAFLFPLALTGAALTSWHLVWA